MPLSAIPPLAVRWLEKKDWGTQQPTVCLGDICEDSGWVIRRDCGDSACGSAA